MQSGTEGGRNCWGREISYIAIVQEEINEGTMEGTGQVQENIQHLASDVTVRQEGKQALLPRGGGWQNGCVINHNRNKSRRPGVKEAEHQGQITKSAIIHTLGWRHTSVRFRRTPKQRCLVTRRTKTG